jgi:hypothetical protein
MDATRVDIFDSTKNITYSALGNENSIEVWPEQTTTYTLYAYGGQGRYESRQLYVVVYETRIVQFSAYPQVVQFRVPPQPVRLFWQVQNASRVELIDGFTGATYPQLAERGSIDVYPEQNAIYTLNVFKANGQVISQQVNVYVNR